MKKLAVIASALAAFGFANAAVIDFENAPEFQSIGNDYQGFDFLDNNMGFVFAPKAWRESAFAILWNGTPNDQTAPAETIRTTSGDAIYFNGADLAAIAAESGLVLTITSFNDGVETGSFVISNLTKGPLESFSFSLWGDAFEFATSGTPTVASPSVFGWQDYAIAVDNFLFSSAPPVVTETPLPAAAMLMLSGLMGLGFKRRRG